MLGTLTSFHDQIHIDETMQETLYRRGRRTAEKFLAGWDFETYVEEFRSGRKDTIEVTESIPILEV